MEQERAISNLGPDIDSPTESSQSVDDAPRQPRKRFIGRRAAAEKAAARGGQDGSVENAGAVTAKPTRPLRALNQVPDSILHDESLNAAIAHLPTNYNFEIHKTVHRIRTSGATNIALQFPEGLLLFAPLISDILTSFCPGSETLIMGDVTYGACCIDDFTARALGCDLLVHYGHSCLVPVDSMSTGIKTLYVFVTIGIDMEHLIATIERNFLVGKRIALVGTIQFNATLHAIVPRLRSLGYDPLLPRSAPLSAGEILGCTAPSLQAVPQGFPNSRPNTTDPASTADMILYLGDGRFHLESILIASPSLRSHTYRYDPYTRRLTHEGYGHEEMHSLRRSAINSARKTLKSPPSQSQSPPSTTPNATSLPHPQTWALILGTLGRQGNPHTLDLIQHHLSRLEIPCITLLLSEISPQKLALMSADVAVWVQVACPRLSIDWGYAFTRPLLSPYEALVALDAREGSWATEREREEGREREVELGTYPMDFYEKGGLGRTRVGDVRAAMEIEVR